MSGPRVPQGLKDLIDEVKHLRVYTIGVIGGETYLFFSSPPRKNTALRIPYDLTGDENLFNEKAYQILENIKSGMKTKSNLLSEFYCAHNKPKNPHYPYLMEDCEKLMWYAHSPFVPVNAFRKILKDYDKTRTNERLKLPSVNEYGYVNLRKIEKVLVEPEKKARYPTGIARVRSITNKIIKRADFDEKSDELSEFREISNTIAKVFVAEQLDNTVDAFLRMESREHLRKLIIDLTEEAKGE
jgi:hypothetical protein